MGRGVDELGLVTWAPFLKLGDGSLVGGRGVSTRSCYCMLIIFQIKS